MHLCEAYTLKCKFQYKIYIFIYEQKGKISDSVLWQKPLHALENLKKQRDNIKAPSKTFCFN